MLACGDAAECTIDLKGSVDAASDNDQCPTASWPLWAEEPEERGDECCDGAFIYFQHACVVDEAREAERQVVGLAVACIGVFVYFYSVLYLDYVGSVQVNRYVEYDVATITAGDYTVEFDIGRALYENFRDHYFDDRNPISEVA